MSILVLVLSSLHGAASEFFSKAELLHICFKFCILSTMFLELKPFAMAGKADPNWPGHSHPGLLSAAQTYCAWSPEGFYTCVPFAGGLFPQHLCMAGSCSPFRPLFEGNFIRHIFFEQLSTSSILPLQHSQAFLPIIWPSQHLHCLRLSSPFTYLLILCHSSLTKYLFQKTGILSIFFTFISSALRMVPRRQPIVNKYFSSK